MNWGHGFLPVKNLSRRSLHTFFQLPRLSFFERPDRPAFPLRNSTSSLTPVRFYGRLSPGPHGRLFASSIVQQDVI